MSHDLSPERRKELLDDFYAECDELLTAVRENLSSLEPTLGSGVPLGAKIETLFRSVHSLKGIAAIAGVREAEQLAHATEDLLRGLSKASLELTAERLDVLLDAAGRLEQIIGAHRANTPLPESGDVLSALRTLAEVGDQKEDHPEVSPPKPTTTAADVLKTLRQRGLAPWRARYSPSAALEQRGINVTAVRKRLGEVGEIASAVPSIRPGGSIVFEFILGVHAAEVFGELSVWEADGIYLETVSASPELTSAQDAAPVSNRENGEAVSLTPSHLVRVDLARLDDLMRIAGDLVIQRSRLEKRIGQPDDGDELLRQIDLGLARSLRELRKAIARVRMVPIAEIFTRMPLVVRDLSSESEKKVRVVLEGPQTEIDKHLVERLKEPLLHLVRNAFTHGIEAPGERVAAGKPVEGTILLRATSLGESVAIQVRDDGGGIDANAVAARATALGMTVPSSLDSASLLQILCATGFSTRDHADRAAGRGVGMAVVANTIRELGGTLALETKLGRGSEFTLRLPVTVSIIDAIIVAVGEENCAIPQSAVDEIVQVPAQEVRRIQQTEVIPYRGGVLPFRRLRDVFEIESGAPALLTIVVLSSERGAVGLVVDRVRSRREVVVRSLTDPLVRVPGVSGATELGDGRPILILNPHALTSGVVRPPAPVEEMVSA